MIICEFKSEYVNVVSRYKCLECNSIFGYSMMLENDACIAPEPNFCPNCGVPYCDRTEWKSVT